MPVPRASCGRIAHGCVTAGPPGAEGCILKTGIVHIYCLAVTGRVKTSRCFGPFLSLSVTSVKGIVLAGLRIRHGCRPGSLGSSAVCLRLCPNSHWHNATEDPAIIRVVISGASQGDGASPGPFLFTKG